MLVLLKNDGVAGLGAGPRRTLVFFPSSCSKWRFFESQEALSGQMAHGTGRSLESGGRERDAPVLLEPFTWFSDNSVFLFSRSRIRLPEVQWLALVSQLVVIEQGLDPRFIEAKALVLPPPLNGFPHFLYESKVKDRAGRKGFFFCFVRKEDW